MTVKATLARLVLSLYWVLPSISVAVVATTHEDQSSSKTEIERTSSVKWPLSSSPTSWLRGVSSSTRSTNNRYLTQTASSFQSMNHHYRNFPRHTPPPPTRSTPSGERRFRKKSTYYRKPESLFPPDESNNESNIFDNIRQGASARYRSLPTLFPRTDTTYDDIAGPRPTPTNAPTIDFQQVTTAAAIVADCQSGYTGAIWGPVPHVLTMDGLAFDVGGPGEFVLATNSNVAAHVQVQSSVDRRLAHMTQAVAIQQGTNRIEIALAKRIVSGNTGIWGVSCAVNAWRNGQPLNLRTGTNYGNTGSNNLDITTSADFLEVSGLGLHMTVEPIESGLLGCYLNVFVCYDGPGVDPSLLGVSGLLGGVPNDDPTDDWTSPSGQVLQLPMNLRGNLAYEYATNNWCVDQSSASLFPNAETAPVPCQQDYLGQINTVYASAAVRQICDNVDGVPSAWELACLANGVAGLQEEAFFSYLVLQQLKEARSRRPTNPPPLTTSIAPPTVTTTVAITTTAAPPSSDTTTLPASPDTTTTLPDSQSTSSTTIATATTTLPNTNQSTTAATTSSSTTTAVATTTATATTTTTTTTSTTVGPTTLPQNVVYGIQPDCYDVNPNGFKICLDIGSASGQVEEWFPLAVAAKERWERIIASDRWGPWDDDYIRNNMPSQYIATKTPEAPIDDIYISIFVQNIDGIGGLNALAGPDVVTGDLDIAAASIQLDPNDINTALEQNYFEYLIMHEIGHCLGLGPLWDFINVLDGNRYVGQGATDAWAGIGCTGDLPVDGNGHWDEGCLQNELMTPILRFNREVYVSQITMGALKDLGYDVNTAEQDSIDPSLLGNCGDRCPAAAGNGRRLRSSNTTEINTPTNLSDEGEKAILEAATWRFRQRDAAMDERKLSEANLLQIDAVSLLYYEGGSYFSRTVHRRDVEHLMK